MPVKPIRDGYHTVTPYLYIDAAAQAIEFYKKAFGATERVRLEGPDGRLGHAEIQIGDSIIMMADEHPEMNVRGPKSRGGPTSTILLYVENVDERFQQASRPAARNCAP